MKNARNYKETNNVAIVRRFIESGKQFEIIDKFTQKNEHICALCLRQAARSAGYYHVTVSVRKGRVWLINELRL